MKKFFFLIFGVAVFVAAVGYLTGPVGQNSGDSPLTRLIQSAVKKEAMSVAGYKLMVEIANNNKERRQGLSGRSSLPQNEGMLFVFEPNGKPTFWMKDMKFPIDIIWINEEGKIVGIQKNVQPESDTPDNDLARYNPPEPVKYVLEVNAGFADTNGIEEGSFAELPESI
jgi:uncharacterized membrane protein (UPF0127 family)